MDPLTLVGKAAEVVGVVAFLELYRLAPPTVVDERQRQERVENANEVNAFGTISGKAAI